MIVISCKNVVKSYGIDVILKNISLNINENERVGLIGSNGVGKSTLFKILTGEIDADNGDVFIDKKFTLGYLSQDLSLGSNLTIWEELLKVFNELTEMEARIAELEMLLKEPYDEDNAEYHDKMIKNYSNMLDTFKIKGGYSFKGEISKVLKGLGFTKEDYDKHIDILSGGQKTRVALCKLLLEKPDILLLDEPTNHLDLNAIEWLEEYLASYKGTIILISHDRFFLDKITTNTFELNSDGVDCYNGNYTKYLDLRQKLYEDKLKAYKVQSQEIKRQEEIIERFKMYNTEKSIKKAESREKLLSRVVRLDPPKGKEKSVKLKFESSVKSGNDVLLLENLGKSYGNLELFKNINLEIKREERIALIGDNGIGKTTLFKIILNKIEDYDGIVVYGRNVSLGYYDQEQSDLDEEKTILDEIWDEFPKMTTTEIRNSLASFLFYGDDVFKKIKNLSGGEKCRINLLKLMLSKNNFLLLDEPTNHLDIPSREALESALLNYNGTLLVISHDRYFLNKVINKIIEMKRDGITSYLGNYNYYLDKKINPNRFEEIVEESKKTKTEIIDEKKKKKNIEKLLREKKAKSSKIEVEIEQVEKRIEFLNEELCREEIFSDYEKVKNINVEIEDLNHELLNLYEEWEEVQE